MSDISKCKGVNCPYKLDCYRFTAPSNEHRQSWFAVTPPIEPNKKCEYFMRNK